MLVLKHQKILFDEIYDSCIASDFFFRYSYRICRYRKYQAYSYTKGRIRFHGTTKKR